MVTLELRDQGEVCSRHRIARRVRSEGLRAQAGYRRRPKPNGGEVATVAPAILDRDFAPAAPNRAWVADVRYIRTQQDWLFLAVVLAQFSRQVVGWSMQSTQRTDVVLQALPAAVWRRKPSPGLLLHSDQGCQFTSGAWQSFLKTYGIVCSMGRGGNCHDNAVAESSFQLLKRERIRRKIYTTHDDAHADVFNSIEMFYNPKRQHGFSSGVSPVEYERRFAESGS
jgi:putative transposase